MRNLKRALSLGLTAAMISGLMVMGSSAASYADVTSENNVEAIEVLEAVGIMIGDENGNFNPDQNVTRNEMAVVMANLMEYNVASYKNTSPFTDVPSWAEPYVAACWTNGITAGYSDTIYGGSDTVTTAQAALMLMKALGYFQYASDFGSDWQLATTRQGNDIDLFVGVDSGVTAPMTRNDVAQLVLNTLKSGTVQAETDGSFQIGDVVINRNVKYNYITSGQTYAKAIDDALYTNNDGTVSTGSIVELGEKLYMGDLKLNDDATDVFGRPARYWEYDGNEIGTYAKTELLRQEYTTEVTGRDLYDLLGKSVIDDYTFFIYVDGENEESVLGDAFFTENQLNRSNDEAVGATGNGVLTQVYQDIDEHEITISVINTYLAKAQEDYDEKNEEVDLTIYELKNVGSSRTPTYVKADSMSEPYTVESDEFDIADVVEDNLFLVTVADGAIQSMVAPEVLSDTTISNFKVDSYVTADGTKYDYSDTVMYDEDVLDQYDDNNMKDVTYNVILDKYGYMIGIEQNEDPDQYLFLTGIDLGSSNLSKKNADANVIFLDGTMDTVTVDMRDSLMTYEADDGSVKTDDLSDLTVKIKGTSDKTRAQLNTWCTYTVDSNGVYTLEQVSPKTVGKIDVAQSATNAYDGDENTFTIDQKNISLDGYNGSRVYGNDDSVYLVVDPEDDMDNITDRDDHHVRIIDDLTSATVGVKNVKLTVKDLLKVGTYAAPDNEVYTLWNDDGYVIAAVVLGEDDGVTTNYAYITSSNVNREADNDGDDWTWTREAVVNGEIVELTEVGTSLRELGNGASNGNMQQGEWYEIKYDADGNVRSAEWIDVDDVPGDKYATSVFELNQDVGTTNKNLMETFDTVVLGDDGLTTGHTITKLTFKNGSLYVDTAATEGFSVSPDVKVVLALGGSMKKDGTWPRFDDVSDSYSGYAGLEKAIRDMNSQGTFAAGIVEVNAVIERGVATSIIINDTAPSDIATSAAVPTVSVANASVAEGKNVTLTATVTAPSGREFGTLSYQWYKDADTDGVAESGEIIAGATDKTYTIENAVKADAGQYICVVTNYDDGKDITGSRESKNQGTGTLTVTDAEMTIRVFYRLTDDTIIDSQILTKQSDNDGDGYVEVTADMTRPKLAGYEISGTDVDYVEFKADGTGSVYFTVEEKASATLTITPDSTMFPTASWTMGTPSKTTVKAGDEVTVTFTQVTASTYENLPAELNGNNCVVSGDGTATCSYALTEKGVAGGTPAEITLTINVESVTTDGGTITVTAK